MAVQHHIAPAGREGREEGLRSRDVAVVAGAELGDERGRRRSSPAFAGACRIVAPMPDVLRPLFDQVVVKELEPDRMRKSGLLVPEGTHDVPPNEGIVLAVGEGPPELPDFKMPVSPGDHVVFPRSAGVWVEVEDERLLVCRVREILGVIETGPPRDEGR
jgi:chaperonin GroES